MENLKSIYPSDLQNAIFSIIVENYKKEVVRVIATYNNPVGNIELNKLL